MLKTANGDYVTLRRYLIKYVFRVWLLR
ncbi:MAG: hypothetical protein L6405_06460 [Actinomycetia bacterium]|nr:hypothetical protein [Actinomycetes bacterium]